MTATALAPLAAGDPADTPRWPRRLALLVGAICFLGGLVRLGFLAEPAVPAGAGRLHDRRRGHHDRRPARQGHRRLRSRVTNSSTRCGHSSPGCTRCTGRPSRCRRRCWSCCWLSHALAPRLPGPLIAVLAATAVVAVFSLDRYGIDVVGAIPSGLPTPGVPDIDCDDLTALLHPGRRHRDRRVLRQRPDRRTFAARHGERDRRQRRTAGARRLQRRHRSDARIPGQLQRKSHRARRRARQPHPALLAGHAGRVCSS